MTDKFFAARNQADVAIEECNASHAVSEMVLNACVRRLVKLDGAEDTAAILYRLADVCAAVDVKPIDHWKAKDRPRWFVRWYRSITWSYWGGLAVGFYLGSTWP